MEYKLKYGSGYKPFVLPDKADVTWLTPSSAAAISDVRAVLSAGLDAPMGTVPMASFTKNGVAPRTVAIAVPDETRPVPLRILLPILLERVFHAFPHLEPTAVRVVVGGGLHTPPDAAQLARILPADLHGCTVLSHDALNAPMRSFGVTSRGTPVEINAAYGDAEYKIVVGQVDPHQFVGMTGGSKGVTIGCASKNMIESNHARMTDPHCRAAAIDENPVRLDLNEAGRMIGINLAVNVVMNAAKEVAALAVGEPETVMRHCAETTARVYGIGYEQSFDIVVASCGGTPKDLCLYQAQKGLNMASHCLREGGHLLLLAACPQGIGDDVYAAYVRHFVTPESQMQEFADRGFRMGAHKAFLFSRTLTKFDVVVASDMDDATLRQCMLSKGEVQATLDRWLLNEPCARIALVPNANASYFYQL